MVIGWVLLGLFEGGCNRLGRNDWRILRSPNTFQRLLVGPVPYFTLGGELVY